MRRRNASRKKSRHYLSESHGAVCFDGGKLRSSLFIGTGRYSKSRIVPFKRYSEHGHCYRHKKDDTVLNVVADKSGFKTVSSKKYGGSFSGTGDLFAAAVAGLTVKGEAPLCATEKAVEFLEGAIRDSYEENTDRNFGVNFEKYLGKLM